MPWGSRPDRGFSALLDSHGVQFVVITLVTIVVGALATIGVTYLFHLPYDLAAGLYAGALTCTPALAAAVDVIERLVPGGSAGVSVGYGVAYPFSMIGVVLLIQFLPKDFAAEPAR